MTETTIAASPPAHEADPQPSPDPPNVPVEDPTIVTCRGDAPAQCYVCETETDSPALHPIPHREGQSGGPLSVPVCPACALDAVGRGLAALRRGGQPRMVGWPDNVRFEAAPPMPEQEIASNRVTLVWGLLNDARAEREVAI